MSKMCQRCCAEITKSNDVEDVTKKNISGLGTREPVWFCKFCKEKCMQESGQDGLTPYSTPLISPSISRQSTDSFVSSCSDILVDEDCATKEDVDKGVRDTGQEYIKRSFLSPAKGNEGSGTITVEYVKGNIGDQNGYRHGNTLIDVDITGSDEALGLITDTQKQRELSHTFDIDKDPSIWLPPAPEDLEDLEDDTKISVANIDDDDECSNGTQWGKASSLGDEFSGSSKYKDHLYKAMEEVMNGEFKSFVRSRLRLEGIFPSGEAGEEWVDIVTSLSWRAALHIQPEAIGDKKMDLEGFVKVKCIATGLRSQSYLINGLVFKKNATHKHMKTKYENPRLLLLQGMLGESSSGFLSLDSMKQDKDYLAPFLEMIENTHPNVVLVEKTVPRGVQESLVAKGITLVLDMKLHRLERIARCTGSQIVSFANSLMNQKLKQCDFFHCEKFVEEHNTPGEGGKKPTKTFMFLEGCSRSLVCTILLKGAPRDELKKIKTVVQHAVIAAYHFILETSFVVDQRATFCIGGSSIVDDAPEDDEGVDSLNPSRAIDIPISDGFEESSAYKGKDFNYKLNMNGTSSQFPLDTPDMSSYENDGGEIAKVHRRWINGSSSHQLETFNVPTVLPGESVSSLLSSVETVPGDNKPVLASSEHEVLTSFDLEKKNRVDIVTVGERAEYLPAYRDEISLERHKSDISNVDGFQDKDGVPAVLDSESILFLMSSRCVLKGTCCEQSHVSRIKYYKNFDMSLERFFSEGLLNQMHLCTACGEPPKAHVYSYIHQSGKLTVQVKHHPKEYCLPGEAEGKLWMWIQCLECKRPTRRVVMSSAARALSFGKFLELIFSSHSASHRLSSCTNSLHKDYISFYGLGPMVAMLRYSSLNIYTACMPPHILEFNNPIEQDWIKREAENVLSKGLLLFTEVSNSLQKIGSGVCSSLSNPSLDLSVPVKGICEAEEMLKQERSDFEAHIQKMLDKNKRCGVAVHETLSLNGLIQVLVLESYVWDQRLQLLLSSDSSKVNSGHKTRHEELMKLQLRKDGIIGRRIEERKITVQYNDKISDGMIATLVSPISDGMPLSPTDCSNVVNYWNPEAELRMKLDETCIPANEFQASELQRRSLDLEMVHPSTTLKSSMNDEAKDELVGVLNTNTSSLHEWNPTILSQDSATRLSKISPHAPLHEKKFQEDTLHDPETLPVDQIVPITEEFLGSTDSVANLLRHDSTMRDTLSTSGPKPLEPGMFISEKSKVSNLDKSENWFWTPFPEILKAYRKDLYHGYSVKFDFINSFTPECLLSANQLISEDRTRLHIPLGPDEDVVTLYEGELTSVIAFALALLKNRHTLAEDSVEEGRKERGLIEKGFENANCVPCDVSATSPQWSSTSSLDSEGAPSDGSASSEDSNTSSFDLSRLVDFSSSVGTLHPEITPGSGKLPGKGKYSVVCLFAKQFHALRRRCCPSEIDYIASLSRCKNWDAKGGKSGSFFVKTFDDRFVVKEIKKTEFESFLKFAPDYFKYVNQSLSSGSQICLAKILGIYQITARNSKSGKEMKYDLMVMENLMFGRNITRVYDLKGALHGRYTSDGTGDVYLDQNFVEDMNLSPLYLSGRTKHLLQRAVWNDTSFLTSINVMDYSLLVGVDTQRQELVCGIIDYLRQYTWDKHLETWVKASLVVPKNVSPTVISPKEYKKRFRKYMSSYILSVPDHWCSEQSHVPCKLCGRRNDISSL